MKRDDRDVLRDVQKETWEAMTVIDTLLDKAIEDQFSMELSRQALQYAGIHNRAVEQLLDKQGNVYRGNHIDEFLLKSEIHADTVFNISTQHLANLMIQKSTKGLTGMWSTMKHHQMASQECIELAQELASLEEEVIQKYREFL